MQNNYLYTLEFCKNGEQMAHPHIDGTWNNPTEQTLKPLKSVSYDLWQYMHDPRKIITYPSLKSAHVMAVLKR